MKINKFHNGTIASISSTADGLKQILGYVPSQGDLVIFDGFEYRALCHPHMDHIELISVDFEQQPQEYAK